MRANIVYQSGQHQQAKQHNADQPWIIQRSQKMRDSCSRSNRKKSEQDTDQAHCPRLHASKLNRLLERVFVSLSHV